MDKRYVISIDGRTASGKTTLAEKLAKLFNAPVVHADDFFLPLDKRTKERLDEPGGNIDYERFKEEVVDKCASKNAFSYQKFECKTKSMGSFIQIPSSDVIIIEGSYSHHPYFGEYADLKIFKTIDKDTQWDRILKRNGAKWGEDFKNKWIPMEEKYFKTFEIEEKTDILI